MEGNGSTLLAYINSYVCISASCLHVEGNGSRLGLPGPLGEGQLLSLALGWANVYQEPEIVNDKDAQWSTMDMCKTKRGHVF